MSPSFVFRLPHDALRALIAEKEKGAGGKVARALILDGAPDVHSGEITDKGYINQALARARRAADLERLFAALAADFAA